MLEAVLLASSTALSYEVVGPPAAERGKVRLAGLMDSYLAGLTVSPR